MIRSVKIKETRQYHDDKVIEYTLDDALKDLQNRKCKIVNVRVIDSSTFLVLYDDKEEVKDYTFEVEQLKFDLGEVK